MEGSRAWEATMGEIREGESGGVDGNEDGLLIIGATATALNGRSLSCIVFLLHCDVGCGMRADEGNNNY